MHDANSIILGSYNCRGYNESKKEFVRHILSKVNILFLQEHWLSDSQSASLVNIDSGVLCTAVSGFDNSEILSGRPYGGCAIFWRSGLKLNVSVLKTDSRRVCAVRMSSDKIKLLLVNVYMPYENSDSNIDEFSDHLFTVERLIVNNLDCHIIIGGDFNVDFSRVRAHTALLRSFCANQDLHVAIEHPNSSVDYTYQFSMTRFSILDHFLLSPALFNYLMTSATVIHDINNLSDHEPIVLELDLAIDCTTVPSNQGLQQHRVSWVKANDGHIKNYREVLSNRLKSIALPVNALTCQNVGCRHVNHRGELDKYARDIVDACYNSSLDTIPQEGPPGRRIPGWSEYVEPFRQKSSFWHKLWVDCGRPRTGPVADSMRRTRAAYHYAIRRTRHCEDDIVRDRFAQALISNRNRDFWQEVRKIRANKLLCNYAIDGHSSADEIARLFGEKYRDLYSSVPYDRVEMSKISDCIESKLHDDGFTSDCVVTAFDVRNALSRLKCDKGDVDNRLSSNHLIYAYEDLSVHIALLLTSLITHGFAPDFFLRSNIRPIPKGHNQNLSDSTNYRAIAISSIFGKVLDNIILNRYHHLLVSSDLQLGFKQGHSTQMCTMLLKETISYYVQNKSTVFCTFLDATKAFDRVHYCKLFKLLIDRRIPPCIVRILISFYVDNRVKVSWLGSNSDYFVAYNGVKQGGVLSPVLFCIYIDDLLLQLSRAGVGCYIGNHYVGALAYADDIVLVAPSPTAMRIMLSICDRFALNNDVRFNAMKSKCVIINPKRFRHCSLHHYGHNYNMRFQINGNDIEFVESYKHLGHIINSTFDDNDDIADKRAVFIGQANNVLCYFGKLSARVKQHLFHSYCMSLFGCELWRLDHNNIDTLCTAWRRAIRRVWSLPLTAHKDLLPLLCNSLPLHDEVCSRTLSFIWRCMSHQSSLIRDIATYGVQFARAMSPVGRNIVFCMRRYRFCIRDFMLGRIDMRHVKCYFSGSVSDKNIATAAFLKELVSLRERTSFFIPDASFMTQSELSDIISYVATN